MVRSQPGYKSLGKQPTILLWLPGPAAKESYWAPSVIGSNSITIRSWIFSGIKFTDISEASPVWAQQIKFSPIFLNDLPEWSASSWCVRRYYLDCLPDTIVVSAVMFSHAYGNNLGTHHFVQHIPVGTSPSDMLERNMKAAQSIKDKIDVYHIRAMQKEATRTFGRICGVKPAFLREICRHLTGDASASHTANEAEVDARVRLVLDCEDPSIVCDLRELNKGRPEKYSKFWEECKQYLESVTELVVQERRHGDITYLASALSAQDLLTEVAKRCPKETPIHSETWLRYQSWPKDPSKQSASQYACRLRVQHMVLARQLWKFHPDAHYASALYRYLQSFAVRYSSSCTFASLDDKHHCKVGEPNYPVAAVKHGKTVLVSLDKAFTVSDHDFTQFSLVPSVDLLVDIPATPDDAFHCGQVCIGLKDLAPEPSSVLRHAGELSKVHGAWVQPSSLVPITLFSPAYKPIHCRLVIHRYLSSRWLNYLLESHLPLDINLQALDVFIGTSFIIKYLTFI